MDLDQYEDPSPSDPTCTVSPNLSHVREEYSNKSAHVLALMYTLLPDDLVHCGIFPLIGPQTLLVKQVDGIWPHLSNTLCAVPLTIKQPTDLAEMSMHISISFCIFQQV